MEIAMLLARVCAGARSPRVSHLNGTSNGQVPETPTTPQEWIAEAERIVARRTLKLPARAHLEAVLGARDHLLGIAAELTNIVALQNRALIALLMSIKQSAFKVPAGAIEGIETMKLDLAVNRKDKDGPIVVRLIQPVADPATPQ